MTFAVPRDDVHVPRPSLGDIVSFSYDVKTRHDIPTRPSVFRIRTDIEWDDVINGARSDRHRSSGKPVRVKRSQRENEAERFKGAQGRGRKEGSSMTDNM